MNRLYSDHKRILFVPIISLNSSLFLGLFWAIFTSNSSESNLVTNNPVDFEISILSVRNRRNSSRSDPDTIKSGSKGNTLLRENCSVGGVRAALRTGKPLRGLSRTSINPAATIPLSIDCSFPTEMNANEPHAGRRCRPNSREFALTLPCRNRAMFRLPISGILADSRSLRASTM